MIQAGDYVISLNTGHLSIVDSVHPGRGDFMVYLVNPTLLHVFWLYSREVRLATDVEVLEAKLKGLL